MNRALNITVDAGTWPASGAPGFPSAFLAGSSSYNVQILPTLLLIGQLTTPPLARGSSLSEFWAWVRYLYAISTESDLRISRDFAALDSHQKTILSDDFGMGIPVAYLIDKLNLNSWSDGRYFLDRMSALVSGPYPVPRKRGPRKAPDFVFSDSHGMLHVVECKGGQSGSAARDRQLSCTTSKGEPSGGVVQKRMVLLPAHMQGQRLACGLSLGVSGKPEPSNLKIVDPEYEPVFDLSASDDLLIGDPVRRSEFARSLRSAGFATSATAVAAPSGLTARAKYKPTTIGRRSSARRTPIERRNDAARAELRAPNVANFVIGGMQLIGREVTMVLPLPLVIDGKSYRRVIIRQGVTTDLVNFILEAGLTEGPMPFFSDQKTEDGHIYLSGGDNHGRLQIARSFLSEIILEEKA